MPLVLLPGRAHVSLKELNVEDNFARRWGTHVSDPTPKCRSRYLCRLQHILKSDFSYACEWARDSILMDPDLYGIKQQFIKWKWSAPVHIAR